MKELKPDSCYKITYPEKDAAEFRTPVHIHKTTALTPVTLRNKTVIILAELLKEKWDHFTEIPC